MMGSVFEDWQIASCLVIIIVVISLFLRNINKRLEKKVLLSTWQAYRGHYSAPANEVELGLLQ